MKLVYLSGGVGGARLLAGLDRIMPADSLSVVVNTADDFVHWGLRICPDLDTIMYTLAGLAHPERGWGLEHESYEVMARVHALNGDDWFQLSDQDLATHVRRSELLSQGQSLTEITAALASALGVTRPLLPMTDAEVHTTICTQDGRSLPFQHWLVRERAAPIVRQIDLVGTFDDNPAVLSALEQADAVLLGPSNPYVSIDPILHGFHTHRLICEKPCFAVSPLVHGQAIKGPLAEMMASLTRDAASSQAIARHYEERWQLRLHGMMVEVGDRWDNDQIVLHEANTIMKSQDDRTQLAAVCLEFIAKELSR